MKKNLSLVLLGVLLGVVLTLSYQKVKNVYLAKSMQRDFRVVDFVEDEIHRNIPGSKVLDVSWSDEKIINVVCDVYYKVNVNYEKEGEIKRIVVGIGLKDNVIIPPSKTSLMLLDKNAEIYGKEVKPPN